MCGGVWGKFWACSVNNYSGCGLHSAGNGQNTLCVCVNCTRTPSQPAVWRATSELLQFSDAPVGGGKRPEMLQPIDRQSELHAQCEMWPHAASRPPLRQGDRQQHALRSRHVAVLLLPNQLENTQQLSVVFDCLCGTRSSFHPEDDCCASALLTI